jgi:hypothetical protein
MQAGGYDYALLALVVNQSNAAQVMEASGSELWLLP